MQKLESISELEFFQQMRSSLPSTDASKTVDNICTMLEVCRDIDTGGRPQVTQDEETDFAASLLYLAELLPSSWHAKYKFDIFFPLSHALNTIIQYRKGNIITYTVH